MNEANPVARRQVAHAFLTQVISWLHASKYGPGFRQLAS